MSLENSVVAFFSKKFNFNINFINLFYFFYATNENGKPRPECMRFLVRFTLLGALFLIFFLLFAIKQKSINIKNEATFLKENISEINSIINNNNFLILVRPKVNLNEPTEEDKEARRLLQLSGGTSDDGIPVAVGHQPNSGVGGSFPQLETAVGAGLLFPIGRYPPGSIRGNAIKGQLTLNVAVVLVVSLLSIAILITAICCVIIIALAMDSTNNTKDENYSTSDFNLSSWPNLMFPQPQIDVETGNNPLTDDEIEGNEEEIKREININSQNNCDLELLIEKEIKNNKNYWNEMRKQKSNNLLSKFNYSKQITSKIERPNLFIV